MPDNGYRYTIDRCDVQEERRSALKRFREERLEWLSWLYKDMHHAIWSALESSFIRPRCHERRLVGEAPHAVTASKVR